MEHPSPTLGQRVWRGILAASFLLVILLPPLVRLTGIDQGSRLMEKRKDIPPPELPTRWQELQAFPERFDAYYKDHFGLRDLFVRAHHWSWRKLLHVSPVPKVVLGKKGWLFLGPPATDYQAMRPMSRETLEDWQSALEGYRDRLAAHGASFVFTVAPNKHSLYPEHLPPGAQAVWEESPLDQLLDHLRRHSAIQVIDLRPSLRAAKAAGRRIYFHNDTHWTPEGDYFAYRGLMAGLARRLTGLEPLPLSAFEASEAIRNGGDLSRMMAIHYRPETYVDLTLEDPRAAPLTPIPKGRRQFQLGKWEDVYENPEKDLRAIMLIDSFGLQLETQVAEHFARIVYKPGVLLHDDLIEREKPDVVILEMVERYMAQQIQLLYLTLGQMEENPEITANGFESGRLDSWQRFQPFQPFQPYKQQSAARKAKPSARQREKSRRRARKQKPR